VSAVDDGNFSKRREHSGAASMSWVKRRNDSQESTEVSIAGSSSQDRTIRSPEKFSDFTTSLGNFNFILSTFFPVSGVPEPNSALSSDGNLAHGHVYSQLLDRAITGLDREDLLS
jgi:hypothetical protein